MHVLEEYKLIKEIRPIFESILEAQCPSEVFSNQAFTFHGKERLYEWTSSRSLSEAVLGVDFPRVSGPVELDHYTTFEAFKNIASSQSLYLFSLKKRLHEGEYSTFVAEHGLKGYETIQVSNKPLYEELSEDLFYTSFTETSHPAPDQMWDNFSDQGKGVRIRFRVTSYPAADLRKMAYQGKQPTALKQINDALKSQLCLTYTPWTLSRICAFYLTFGFRHEREVRLLVKRHVGGPDCSIAFGNFRVWPIPIVSLGMTSPSKYCCIEMIGVTAGARCTIDRVRGVLDGSTFGQVPITKCGP